MTRLDWIGWTGSADPGRGEKPGLERPSPAAVVPLTVFVDLHAHSLASDGTDTPAEFVRKAARAGLSAIALTDHDTTAGLEEAAAEAGRLGIGFLAGIEISAIHPRPGVMHLLGYGFDPHHPALRRMTADLQASRNQRNRFLIEQLCAVGVRIDEEELNAVAGNTGVVGRPHFARLLALKGYVPHPQAAFRHYLGNAGRFRFDRYEPAPAEAIATIHAAGGLVSAAHPMQWRKENFAQVAHELKSLADQGLDAVEVLHSDHRESLVAELESLADRYGLLKTGGSDYHGGTKKWITLGRAGERRRIPRAFYDRLVARLGERRAA